MTPAPTPPVDLPRVLDALHRVWNEDPAVQQFHLRFIPERAAYDFGSWLIPVASGSDTGSAYEFVRALDRMQERAESLAHATITLYFDPHAAPGLPPAPPSTNGAH